MDNFTYLLYSHESYSDVLDIHLNQFNEYFPHFNIIIGFNNKKYIDEKYNEKYNEKYKVLEYNDNDPYMKRISYILTEIKTPYILFVQDINIPINNHKNNIFNTTLSFMEKNKVDQVRMFAAGIPNPIFDDNLFHKINSGYFFSINTAMWKTNSLLKICSKFQNHTYRCAECMEIQNFVKNNMHNCYTSSTDDIKLKNKSHVISHNFPFCHITSNGKWDALPKYHLDLLNKYNIDINIRGYVK